MQVMTPNAIVIIIDGIGSRTEEPYDGFPARRLALCVEYICLVPTVYDCPVLSANIGYPCDDGDPPPSMMPSMPIVTVAGTPTLAPASETQTATASAPMSIVMIMIFHRSCSRRHLRRWRPHNRQ